MRILVNDFAGHPFPLQLSRYLAHCGHTLLHIYFADNNTPKGRIDSGPDLLEIEAVHIAQTFQKHSLCFRRGADLKYGWAVRKSVLSYRPDLVISANTPLDAQQILLQATREAGGAFVYWLQDILSQGIEFVLRRRRVPLPHLLGTFYRRLERRLLQQSDAIVCIAPSFRATLAQWRVEPNKTFVVPNWAPTDEVRPLPRNTAWAEEHRLDGRFRFLYSGTLGMKHKPELLLALARHFESHRDVLTVVVAEGAGADWLRSQQQRIRPGALRMLPFQPYDRLAEVLASGDVLVSLLDEACGAFAVPSKTLAYLCAGRPLLLACPENNLAAEIVRSAGAGEVVNPTVADLLAAAERLRKDDQARELYSKRARSYAERTFAIESIAQKFLEVFEFACKSTGRIVPARGLRAAAAGFGR